MNFPELVGHLRRFRSWSTVRDIRRSLSQLTSCVIHLGVLQLGPKLVPGNLWLKHIYDYETVYVDPQLISQYVKVGGWRKSTSSVSPLRRANAWFRYGDGLKSVRTHVTRNFHGDFVADGDWDIHTNPFHLLPVVTQLFEEGRSPRETDEYQRYLRRINDGQLTWARGLRNQAELDNYFDMLARTYEDIKVEGYRRQEELGLSGSDEIRVCVNRNGQICVYGGGTHRLSIAKFLDLDVVPVSLKRVHSRWVDSIAGSSSKHDESVIRHGLLKVGFQTDAIGQKNVGREN